MEEWVVDVAEEYDQVSPDSGFRAAHFLKVRAAVEAMIRFGSISSRTAAMAGLTSKPAKLDSMATCCALMDEKGCSTVLQFGARA